MNETYFNDKISVEYLKNNKITSSLLLIKPTTLEIRRQDVMVEGMYGSYEKKKIRAVFTYNGVEYNLGVTDPIIEQEYKSKDEGIYKLSFNKIYLCISLAEPFPPLYNYCYKLVATIIGIAKGYKIWDLVNFSVSKFDS